jgi:diguanylate cyclase (GGDEF)-like protein
MLMANRQVYTEDEFLKQPALFRYGPRTLWVLGLTLAALCYMGAQKNAADARRDSYIAALRYVGASANAANQAMEQLLALTQQASRAVLTARAAGVAPEDFLASAGASALVPTASMRVALLSHEGRVLVPASIPGSSGALTQELERATRNLRVSPAAPLRVGRVLTASGVQWLPVLQSLPGDAQGRVLAYLIETDLVTAAWRQSLGGEAGWLQLTDREGAVLFELVDNSDGAPPRNKVVRSVTAGMAVPLNWESTRWVAADASGATPVRVRSGITEQAALKEYRRRFSFVMSIVWGVATLILGLAGSTAYALKRFEKKEAYLRRLATVDVLTELPNRRNFHTLLARAAREAQQGGAPLALLFVDLDNFKYVNDTLGHEAGDRLLRQVASMLVNAVGERGQVCRLGGDEFTVLLPGVASAARAQHVGERIAMALHAPLEIDGLFVQPRASVGVALLPTQAKTASDLMRYADMALYQAKRNGKGCAVVYDEAMGARELAGAALMQELERAIAQDELTLHYQPKYQLADHTLSGFEALVRWQHPQRGLLPPGEFIAAAEKNGLIVDLGNWVLRRAVRQMRQWRDLGYGWQRVAVNVSPLQLRNDGFVNLVRTVLEQHEVPGRFLQLELTESSLAADPAKAQALVRALRALGVAVAVDDFGTGYSSLATLQGLELDCLKIDRSFVLALDTQRGLEVCRAVVSFGHALGLKVIAEGVETPRQRDDLSALECDEVQGYLYSRPLEPAQAIAKALGRAPSGALAALQAFDGELAVQVASDASRQFPPRETATPPRAVREPHH